MADIERAPDTWSTDARWPAAGTAATTLRPRNGTAPGVGVLGDKPAPHGATAAFTDDPKLSEADWAADIDRSAVDFKTPDQITWVTNAAGTNESAVLFGDPSMRLK